MKKPPKKPARAKAVRAWALATSDGELLPGGLSDLARTRDKLIELLEMHGATSWRDQHRRGWRIVPVEIREAPRPTRRKGTR